MRDLAYRRAVIHSAAADYDHCGHLVTSGDPEAFWLSGDSGGEWLLFDLGGPCRIRRIRIAWLSCPAGLEVQVPGEGTGWRTVLAPAPGQGEQTLCPGELSTDRLRLFFRMAPGERCGVRRLRLPARALRDGLLQCENLLFREARHADSSSSAAR